MTEWIPGFNYQSMQAGGVKVLAVPQPVNEIFFQIKQLSREHRLYLTQLIIQTLLSPSPKGPSKHLQFGKYKANRESTLEDFAIAEWHPSEKELNVA